MRQLSTFQMPAPSPNAQKEALNKRPRNADNLITTFMPRARSKSTRTKSAKRALPKEAVSLTDWKCWPLVSSSESMVWPESETSFWRQQKQEDEPEQTPQHPRARALPAAPSPIARAIFLCKAQAKFLDKTREALQRMQELAILVQQSAATGRDACLEEFDTLVSFLDKLADTEIEGVKLFESANVIIPLEGDNRLIMAGIDLNSESFRGVLRARIGTADEASSALAALQKAIRFIAINREILSSNIGRLFFTRDRLDEVKQSLQAAAV